MKSSSASLWWLVALPLLGSGCGGPPREPGFPAGALFDWRLTGTERTFERCTDASGWRASFDGAGLVRRVVQVSEGGTTASLLFCEAGAAQCVPFDPPVTLSVSGATLQYTGSLATSVEGAPSCRLIATEDLQIVDHGDEMRETLRYQFHLDGDPTECAEANARSVDAGTNGEGVEGCRVTFTSVGVL